MDWLNKVPRQTLGHWPTPLEPLHRLSKELGGPKIWLKRDDCSGLLTGGNKTRKLEYLLADAVSNSCDTVITFGAIQSNHARQTAAACAKLGIECHLILTRRVKWPSNNYESNGNMILNQLCGAHLHLMESEEAEAKTKALIESLAFENKSVYLIPPGGSNARGALGYANCARELSDQFDQNQIDRPILVHASASAGTQSGLIFGLQSLGAELQTIGVNVYHESPDDLRARIKVVLGELVSSHRDSGISEISDNLINIENAYLGKGYGVPSKKTIEAIKLTARLEGIAFDPVYSGKALEALMDKTILGDFDDFTDIILIHTGGIFALPVYEEALVS